MDSLVNGCGAYWKLDEGVVGVANDSVGAYDLTQSNGLRGAGKIGGCFESDVAVPYGFMYYPALIPVFGGTLLSISSWIKLGAADGGVFSLGSSPKSFDIATSSGSVRFGIFNSGGTVFNAVGSAGISAGTWKHIVVTYDGSQSAGSRSKIYADGVDVTTSDATLSTYLTDPAQLFRVGVNASGSSYFRGSIDEVGIWNRVLSQAEVTFLYSFGRGISYPFSIKTALPPFLRQ